MSVFSQLGHCSSWMLQDLVHREGRGVPVRELFTLFWVLQGRDLLHSITSKPPHEHQGLTNLPTVIQLGGKQNRSSNKVCIFRKMLFICKQEGGRGTHLPSGLLHTYLGPGNSIWSPW